MKPVIALQVLLDYRYYKFSFFEGLFTGQSMEVYLQDTRSRMTPYLPQMEIGFNMPEIFSSYPGARYIMQSLETCLIAYPRNS